MRFVFTGGGVDHHGRAMQRNEIFRDVRLYGHVAEQNMSAHTDVLVASRNDTVKVSVARSRGLEVWTYDQFWQYLHGNVLPSIPSRLSAVPLLIGQTTPAFREPQARPMTPAAPHPVPLGHILSNGRRMIDL